MWLRSRMASIAAQLRMSVIALKSANSVPAGGRFKPPAPLPRSPVAALIRAAFAGERDLLSLLPDIAYRELVTPLGISRRNILLVNDPQAVTDILANGQGWFPKNDLMVGALEGLVGDSIFVSDGAAWKRQRRMIDPAFSHMRINQAFTAMSGAVEDYLRTSDGHAASGAVFSLDAAMSLLTADIICRTIFSRPLDGPTGWDVFHAFADFERSVAQVSLGRLLLGKPFAKVPQPPAVREACRIIRGRFNTMLDEWTAKGGAAGDDIAGAIIAARDPETGECFSREELIDQIGVFYLAGHETTASVLTWAFFVLSQKPEIVARMRMEIAAVAGDGPILIEHTKKMSFVRNVFRETLRLYPPITFIPRVAAVDTEVAGRRVKRGAMIMIAPWTLHRHQRFWRDPDVFDPDRFVPDREKEIRPGTYIPFGLGPRICVGAAFATVEAGLILASLVRRYDIVAERPEEVRPVSRLTTRPAREIMCRLLPIG
jgi:cytochrome P450